MQQDDEPTTLSPTMYQLLTVLDESGVPVGARVALRRLVELGVSVSEATVARLLNEADRRGLTAQLGRKGRRLTLKGRRALDRARLGYRTGQTIGQALDIQQAESLLDLLALRRGVETEAAGLAAKRATAEDLEQLDRNVAAYYRIGDSLEGRDEVGQAFHQLVIGATHSPLLASIDSLMLHPKVVALSPVMNIITSGHGTHGEAPGEHRLVFEAIAAGDAEAASAAMAAHLNRFMSEVEDFVGSNSEGVIERLLSLQHAENPV